MRVLRAQDRGPGFHPSTRGTLKNIPTHVLVEELRGREDVKAIEMFCEGPAEIKFQGPTTILEIKG